MLFGLMLLVIVPQVMVAFTIISTVSAILVIFTWSMITLSYIVYSLKFKQQRESALFRLPGGIYTAITTLLFLLFTLSLLWLREDTRIALYVMPLWFVFLFIASARNQAAATGFRQINELERRVE